MSFSTSPKLKSMRYFCEQTTPQPPRVAILSPVLSLPAALQMAPERHPLLLLSIKILISETARVRVNVTTTRPHSQYRTRASGPSTRASRPARKTNNSACLLHNASAHSTHMFSRKDKDTLLSRVERNEETVNNALQLHLSHVHQEKAKLEESLASLSENQVERGAQFERQLKELRVRNDEYVLHLLLLMRLHCICTDW